MTKFNCNYCTNTYNTKRGLQCHKGIAHSTEIIQEQQKEHQCTMCSKSFDVILGLQQHLGRTHNLTNVETYMVLNNITEIPKCDCGCGEDTNFSPGKNGGFATYKQGHVARVKGGFYSEEGNLKSHETRRERFKSGEIQQWNKGVDLYEYWGNDIYEQWLDNNARNPERNKKLSNSMKESRAKRDGYENWDEWFSQLSEREQYYHTVRVLTEQNVHLIPNYNETKRGLAGIKGAHHIDHIIPITKGYKSNIPPEQIADVSNLQFIPWKENLKKGPR